MAIKELIENAKGKGVKIKFGIDNYPSSLAIPEGCGFTNEEIEQLHDITRSEWFGDEPQPIKREPFYGC